MTKEEKLVSVCKAGNLQEVVALVEHGANIHVNDDCSLRWASYYGHLEVVKYLVEHGVNIHARDDGALRWASERGHLEVVEYLKLIKLVRERQRKLELLNYVN